MSGYVPTCGRLYSRPNGPVLECTYVRAHGGYCSWHVTERADERTSAQAASKIDYTPAAVQAFLDSMTRGEMDPYLEAILAVGHSRKRSLRNVPGFR